MDEPRLGPRAAVATFVALTVWLTPLMGSFDAARANDPGEQDERAYARWRVKTDDGTITYELEARRAFGPGEEPVTTGFISTGSCLSDDDGRGRMCISASDFKRVLDGRFGLDPSMSTATFRMRFAGRGHAASWDASTGIPAPSMDELARGNPSVERPAEAGGTAFGTPLSTQSIDEAVIERGAEVSDEGSSDPPLPGFGRLVSASSTSGCWQPRDEERAFARAMNEERAQRDLSRMRLDPELSKAARVHTNEMLKASSLHHTSSATLGRRVTKWIMLGENVGVGGTVPSLHSAFMASPAHKDNILFSRFNHVGIGTTSEAGRLWVTVIFESREDPGTRLRMPC